jgi:hypothetical protein
MAEISPEIQAQLAGLSENDWAALTAKVRAPDTSEQLRAEVAKQLGGDTDRAAAFAAVARLDQFTVDGKIDTAKVVAAVTGVFGSQQQQSPARYGQGSGNVGGPRPGDGGRAELAKRFGVQHDQSPIGQPAAKGQAGRDAADRRFGTAEGKK